MKKEKIYYKESLDFGGECIWEVNKKYTKYRVIRDCMGLLKGDKDFDSGNKNPGDWNELLDEMDIDVGTTGQQIMARHIKLTEEELFLELL